MSDERAASYRALGLEPGASADEIKRAYFKLVRVHSPEKDPKGFEKIRAAYEMLREEKESKASSGNDLEVPMPDPNSQLGKFLETGNYYINNKQRRKAAEVADIIRQFWPKDPAGLLYQGIAYMSNGNSQKAAQAYEDLFKQYPDSATAASNLAYAYARRGWGNKALQAFRKAVQLGMVEFDFLHLYAETAAEFGYFQDASEIAGRMISETEWNKERAEDIPDVFDYFFMARMDNEKARAAAEQFWALMLKYWRVFEDNPYEVFNTALAIFEAAPSLYAYADFIQYMRRKADELCRKSSDYEEPMDFLKRDMDCGVVEYFTGQADQDWTDLFEVRHITPLGPKGMDVSELQELDAKLNILMDWEEILPAYRAVKKNAPFVLEGFESFFEEAEADKDALFWKLKSRMDEVGINFSGVRFYDRFPEMRVQGKIVHSAAEGQFTREGEKVGRNDPCPCGSGKKFKKCCMGKGIYD